MGYLLGLDLGPTSVGWAVFELGKKGPTSLKECGSRIFAAGVAGSLLEIREGKDASKNISRREARQVRRQLERRARRKFNIAHQLARAGLLPPADWLDPSERDKAIKALDREIGEKYRAELGDDPRLDFLPYFLRARALDHPLEPYELGRALYHLGQRRGFLSNRKAPSQDDKEEGKVYEGISNLQDLMQNAKSRTLGEYFAGLDPHDTRIRERWTARSMYIEEFDRILGAQHPHHLDRLTPEVKERLHRAMFFQRPLKSQKGLIGKCELEDGERRIAVSRLLAQRYRILQKVNDLRIVYPDLTERTLTPEERAVLLTELSREKEKTWAGVKKLLRPFEKLPKDVQFNLQRGGEKSIKGNVTAARIRQVIGDRWDVLSDDDQEAMVEDLRSMVNEEALKKRAQSRWGLDGETARKFARIRLEDDYLKLSAKAIRKLLPLMEDGVAFATAKEELYADSTGNFSVCDLLPPVDEAPFELRNPAVHRVLVELRKVVNAVIRKHGKPHLIRIELARDLKKSRKDRTDISKRNRDNQKTRDKAKAAILAETGNSQPRGRDVLLAVLHEECGGMCPYTGKSISLGNLLGSDSQFDIEHIIPYHRCFDDSFNNKTLCYNEENRHVKQHKTPYEAYNDDRYHEIVERVKRFRGPSRDAKLRRFLMKDLADLEEFTNKHLADTRYATRLAADYLSLLYGGRYDTGGTLRIQATTGQITSDLRRAWRLNDVLGGDGEKSRDDHRHHAIDAIATALTDARTVRSLSKANKKGGWERRRQWWKDVPPPWPNFFEDVSEAVSKVVVSHRPQRRVSGALHQETLYSPPKPGPKGKNVAHIRRKLDKLKKTEIEAIVDEATRERVKKRLVELGESDPAKAFADRENHPWFDTPEGPRYIHKVRVRANVKTFPIGSGPTERHVKSGSNHHMEIFEVTDAKGCVKWKDRIVDMYTATQRLKNRQPVVNREWDGPGEGRFVFTLTFGDSVRMRPREEFESPEVLQVRGISRGDLEFCRATDSRLKKEIKDAKHWFRTTPDGLRNLGCQKIDVTPTGEIRHAHD